MNQSLKDNYEKLVKENVHFYQRILYVLGTQDEPMMIEDIFKKLQAFGEKDIEYNSYHMYDCDLSSYKKISSVLSSQYSAKKNELRHFYEITVPLFYSSDEHDNFNRRKYALNVDGKLAYHNLLKRYNLKFEKETKKKCPTCASNCNICEVCDLPPKASDAAVKAVKKANLKEELENIIDKEQCEDESIPIFELNASFLNEPIIVNLKLKSVVLTAKLVKAIFTL